MIQSLNKYLDKEENIEMARSVGTIIIDECHRGSSTESGDWRKILDHFDMLKHKVKPQ